MRRPFNQFVEFFAGVNTSTPLMSRGIFLCRAVREERTTQVGSNAVQIPYYLTLDEYLPVPCWITSGLQIDWTVADTVEITQVPDKTFYVYHVDSVVADDLSSYYRAWLADIPGGGVTTGGRLIFGGSATVTFSQFSGGLVFGGGLTYGSRTRQLLIIFSPEWYMEVFSIWYAGLFVGLSSAFSLTAIAPFIFGGAATISSSSASDLLIDTFTWPNDTQADGHSLENGSEMPKSWFTSEGSFKTEGSILIQDGNGVGTDGRGSCLVTCDVSDGTVTLKLRCFLFLGDVRGGIRFRSSDLDNYWLATMDTVSGWVRLYQRVSGVDMEISNAVAAITQSSIDWTTLQVVMSGSDISVVVDGTTLLTTTDSFNSTEVTHGLIAFLDGVTWSGNLYFDEWILDT